MFPPMTDEQRATFHTYYPRLQRDEVTGVSLAVLLGSFGAHHFYLRRNGLGVIYFLLCWTSIPFFLGLIEAFFMPERVRRFNAEQAALLAYSVVQGVAQPTGPLAMTGCGQCGMVQAAGVRYCVQCGRGMV